MSENILPSHDLGKKIHQSYDPAEPDMPVQKINVSGNNTQYSFVIQHNNKIREERFLTWTADAIHMNIITYNGSGKDKNNTLKNADSCIHHAIPYNDPAAFTSEAYRSSGGKWHKWGDWSEQDRYTKQRIEYNGMIAKRLDDIVFPATGISDTSANATSGSVEKQRTIYAILNQNKDVFLMDLIEAGRPAMIVSIVQNMKAEEAQETLARPAMIASIVQNMTTEEAEEVAETSALNFVLTGT